MRRRTALASIATAGLSTMAGCSVGGPARLTDPEVESRAAEELLRFTDDAGETVARLEVVHRLVRVEGVNQYVRLTLTLVPLQDTEVQSLRYRLFRPDASSPFTTVYAERFPASYRLYRESAGDAPSGFVFELSDTGMQRGSIVNRLQAWTEGDPDAVDVGIATAAMLDEPGLLGGSLELDTTIELTAEPL